MPQDRQPLVRSRRGLTQRRRCCVVAERQKQPISSHILRIYFPVCAMEIV